MAKRGLGVFYGHFGGGFRTATPGLGPYGSGAMSWGWGLWKWQTVKATLHIGGRLWGGWVWAWSGTPPVWLCDVSCFRCCGVPRAQGPFGSIEAAAVEIDK